MTQRVRHRKRSVSTPAAPSAGGQTLSGEASWPPEETGLAWEHGGLVTGCAGGSSDAGDKQKPGTPELHKHIYLQFRSSFFSQSHLEIIVVRSLCSLQLVEETEE